ncbi:SRPBCC family protein [Paenibacillus arenilitoris]|uniref:SRPBCC domain-containing protein n=1 Tax=Paenibacillus arenilitoris TaxID=2772299 RepID=A0A927H691_9BACL|nr:SRPBCC family protein [Paenibacillus arenilitoris]MBD2870301.1 SRPBCC domain-containing protein [Paenibacillus arenilitoris]
MNPIHSNDAITKELFIECRPETLFAFFTDPDKLVRWMGRHVLLDPSIGGKYRIDINGSDIAMGEYKEIVPNEKIVMTWGWEKSKTVPPGSSTVEFKLTSHRNGTLLTLTHYGLPTAKEIASHEQGWTHYMARIQTLGQGMDPGKDPWSEQAMH